MTPKQAQSDRSVSARGNAKVASSARKKKAARLTVVLATFVALCTAWALMVPAITITSEKAQTEAGFYVETAPQGEMVASADLTAGVTQSLGVGQRIAEPAESAETGAPMDPALTVPAPCPRL